MKTLKMTEKIAKKIYKSTNFRPKRSFSHCVIKPVMSFDKLIDVMGLNENYLICIFLNINQNVENRVKQGENYSYCRVFDGLYDLYCISETNFHSCQCGQRDHRLHDVKFHSFLPAQCYSKE